MEEDPWYWGREVAIDRTRYSVVRGCELFRDKIYRCFMGPVSDAVSVYLATEETKDVQSNLYSRIFDYCIQVIAQPWPSSPHTQPTSDHRP